VVIARRNFKKGYYIEPTIFETDNNNADCPRGDFRSGRGVHSPSRNEAEPLKDRQRHTLWPRRRRVVPRHIQMPARRKKIFAPGIVWVNTMPTVLRRIPWGGYKASGQGRELSLHAWMNSLETKQVTSI